MSGTISTLTQSDLWSLLPELILATGGVVILLLDALFPAAKRLWMPLALATTAVAAWGAWAAWNASAEPGFSWNGLLETSHITYAFSLVILVSTALALLASESYLRRERILGGEYFALLLWCVSGLLLMLRATELLTVFLALELLSVCLYVLAGYHRRLALSVEAAIKYFLMGAFVSAFALYGIALVFGATGSTRIAEIGRALEAGQGTVFLSLGVLLLVAAFGFKMSVAPFHAWSPDTYQGAPSPFVAFLSVAPKVASALVLYRLLEAVALGGFGAKWSGAISALAVLSMVVGNLLALVQRDLKRMLAYSGVAHMGYLLLALVEVDRASLAPVLVYLLAYVLMNAGAFTVVSLLYNRPGEQHLISDLSGWGYRHPLLGACLAISMLSLGGIPPTAGFIGKYMVFLNVIEDGHWGLAIVGVLASLVGVFYYLRVVYVLYMKQEAREPQGLLIDLWGRTAAVAAAVATLVLGVWPTELIRWLMEATATR